MELNKELIQKAKEAKSVEELMAFAKDNGVELSKEQADAFFKQHDVRCGEIADDELDNVSGGGCSDGGGELATKYRMELVESARWDGKSTKDSIPGEHE